jgi:hypothetical protein
MGKVMTIYVLMGLAMWAVGAMYLRRMTDARGMTQAVGGLLLAVLWPLSASALCIILLSDRPAPAPSVAPASVGLLPLPASPRAGRPYGPVRHVQDMRRDHPSAS